jgi:hypothetical protein
MLVSFLFTTSSHPESAAYPLSLNNAIGVHEAKVNPDDIEKIGLMDFKSRRVNMQGFEVQTAHKILNK